LTALKEIIPMKLVQGLNLDRESIACLEPESPVTQYYTTLISNIFWLKYKKPSSSEIRVPNNIYHVKYLNSLFCPHPPPASVINAYFTCD